LKGIARYRVFRPRTMRSIHPWFAIAPGIETIGN
jgi:hypothetical protein